MFNQPGTILQAISDTLQQAGVSNLPPQWSSIAQQNQARAYNMIVSVLSGRGFTAAQIAAWDRGTEFELDMAIFFSLQRGGSLATSLDDKFLKTFDRRDELKEVIYTTGGSVADPQGTAGLPNVGDMDTSEDIFVLPPSDSGQPYDDFPGPGRGELTRF